MNRAITNSIRFVMDECIPSGIRDSYYFMWPFYYLAYGGRDIHRTMNFKKLVWTWSDQDYHEFYNNLNSISRNRKTDLNKQSITEIISSISQDDKTVLDVGCSSGYLLKQIQEARPHVNSTGCDILVGEKEPQGFNYVPFDGSKLPFADKSFDVVVCTHTLEHILEPKPFVDELKRVCRKHLLIVVPKQRFFLYTLDEHVNFFLFEEQLTSLIDMQKYLCKNVGGDWFFNGDVDK